jgi:hypothetical protein
LQGVWMSCRRISPNFQGRRCFHLQGWSIPPKRRIRLQDYRMSQNRRPWKPTKFIPATPSSWWRVWLLYEYKRYHSGHCND